MRSVKILIRPFSKEFGPYHVVGDGGTVPRYFGTVQGRKKGMPNIKSSTPKEIIPEDPLRWSL
jgi:hypothetical protein